MDSNYVYLIYRDDIHHTVDIVAKVGKGRKNRYRTYTTPYGSGYKVYLVYPTMEYSTCESEILAWCRSKGYLKDGSEVVTTTPNDTDTWKDLKNRHLDIILNIKSKMNTYGIVHECGIKNRRWYIIPIEEVPIPKATIITPALPPPIIEEPTRPLQPQRTKSIKDIILKILWPW